MPTYTRRELASRLRHYTSRLGHVPRTTELYRLGGPGRNTFIRVFGVKTWKEVVEAAGLEEFVAPKKKPWEAHKRRPVTREDVVDAYRRIITTEGILPTIEDNLILYKYRTKFFPTEEAVVKAAGFDYDFLRRITDRVIFARKGRKPKIGYYEAVIAEYPWLARYSREFIESYMGEHPATGQIDKKIEESERRESETISPEEHWKMWQKYYVEELYRPPEVGEPHETVMDVIIMRSKSPEEALARITRLSEKYPSSVGADLAEEFKRLWYRTRTNVLKPHQQLKHPGYLQIERPRKAG